MLTKGCVAEMYAGNIPVDPIVQVVSVHVKKSTGGTTSNGVETQEKDRWLRDLKKACPKYGKTKHQI